MIRSLSAVGYLLTILAIPAAGEDFALRDGDVVVFVGDSITAARTYGRIVENYTLLRFPDRNIKFANVGIGGDTAAGGLKRLERDVFSRGATVLTVAFGVNDIGWGVRADEAHKKTYLDAIRGIVQACRDRDVRVYICSAAITAEDPDRAETGFLQTMCDEGMAIARELGGASIDVQRSMRQVQRRVLAHNETIPDPARKVSMHVADGVHLNELGQLAMAFAILKGLHAPAEVSSASIAAVSPRVLDAAGCEVTNLSGGPQGLSFTRLDRGLPFNYDLFYGLNYAYVPVPEELNRYMLTIKDLAPGRYSVTADGVEIGQWSAGQLAAGVNISSATTSAWTPGSPWAAQGHLLRLITEARNNTDSAVALSRFYLPQAELPAALAAQASRADAELVSTQRLVARPRPYRLTVRPAAPTAAETP